MSQEAGSLLENSICRETGRGKILRSYRGVMVAVRVPRRIPQLGLSAGHGWGQRLEGFSDAIHFRSSAARSRACKPIGLPVAFPPDVGDGKFQGTRQLAADPVQRIQT